MHYPLTLGHIEDIKDFLLCCSLDVGISYRLMLEHLVTSWWHCLGEGVSVLDVLLNCQRWSSKDYRSVLPPLVLVAVLSICCFTETSHHILPLPGTHSSSHHILSTKNCSKQKQTSPRVVRYLLTVMRKVTNISQKANNFSILKIDRRLANLQVHSQNPISRVTTREREHRGKV